jgi:NhaP-type Na+/H+ or K+/H+ antiporter
MEIRKRALGLSLGLVWGLAVLLGTWWLLIFGYKGEIMGRLSQFYIGYSFTYIGAIMGLIWGFIDGFIAGVLIAWFYDLFSKMLYKSKT